MKASVFDTYVKKKNGVTMHFDIVVPENTTFETVQIYGQQYLETRGEAGQALTAKECRFCHIETATEDMLKNFDKNGYHIIEMEGCQG